MKIAGIDGGIDSLCTAYLLQQQNYDISIFEATSALCPIGAGIGIAFNAI